MSLPLAALLAALATADTPAPSDSALLRTLHERVMEAHRTSNVEMLLSDAAPEYVMANRGEITHPTVADIRNRLGPYLKRTRFAEYRDLVEPIVQVSDDGSLGWVIVQVQARGIQTNDAGKEEKLEFVSAWIELYRKRAGRWYSVGNVSNFKP